MGHVSRLAAAVTLMATLTTVTATSLPGVAAADPPPERSAEQPGPNLLDPGASAIALAQAIAADPSQLTGAAFEAKPPNGTPVAVADSGTALAGFPTAGSTYGILTTGNASLAPTANTSSGSGADDAGPNVRGNTDFDVTILRMDFNVPLGATCLSIDFRFLSEEFPEYVNSAFNDAFIAEIGASTWTTSGSTISAPNNFAFDQFGQVVSINAAGPASMSSVQSAGTTYDGATPLLQAATPVLPGPLSLYLSIFDQGDRAFDSAVFVDNAKFHLPTANGASPQPDEL